MINSKISHQAATMRRPFGFKGRAFLIRLNQRLFRPIYNYDRWQAMAISAVSKTCCWMSPLETPAFVSAPLTTKEKRLVALAGSRLLDTLPEEPFDRLTRFAAKFLHVPVVLLSLIDHDRQFLKSQCGLPSALADNRQFPLSHSICKHVVETGAPLIIADARLDPLIKTNLSVRDFGVVAYAGIPLIDRDGYRLGSFCAIDSQPRNWTAEEIEFLTGIAAQAMTEIELRNKTREMGRDLTSVRQLQRERESAAQLTVRDLRFPLGSMLLCLEMLPRLGTFNGDQNESLSLCLRSGQMLRSILEDLLDVAAIEKNGVEALCYDLIHPAALGDLAISQITAFAKEKTIRVERILSLELPQIRVDEHKIVRLLANALDILIKNTRCGGTVRLSAALSELPAREIVFIISEEEGRIQQRTTNKPSDQTDFRTTEMRNDGGNELVLAYCRTIAEAHGGSISVQVTEGQKRIFKVSLPTVAPHPQRP